MPPMFAGIALILLYVGAIATGGWDNWFAALIIASVSFLAVSATTLTATGRDALSSLGTPRIAVFGFTVAIAAGVSQLAAIPGLGHPMWPLAGVAAGNGPGSVDPHATAIEVVKLLGLAAAFLVGAAAARDDRAPSRLIAVFLGATVVYVAVQAATAAFFSFERGRLGFGLGSANVAASVMGVAALASAAWALREAKRSAGAGLVPLVSRTGLAWVIVAMMAAGVVVTASRAGWAVLILGALAFVVVELLGSDRKDRGAAAGVSAGLFLSIVGVAIVMGGALWARFADMMDAGNADRLDMIAAHRPVVEAALWRGHGLGSYEAANAVYADAAASEALLTAGSLHNAYVQMLEEAGVIGAAALLIAVFALGWAILRGRFVRRMHRAWLTFGVGAFVLVAAHAAVEYTLNVYAVASLGALGLGVLSTLAGARR